MRRYDECITKLTPFLKMSGWAVGGDDVIFIPISGLGGINLKERIPAACVLFTTALLSSSFWIRSSSPLAILKCHFECRYTINTETWAI